MIKYGKTWQDQDFLDVAREVLTLILRKYAFSYISTSFTSACSSDNSVSKSPKVSQTVAVLSFGWIPMMADGGKFLLLTKITLLLVSFNRPKGETQPDCSPKYFFSRSAEAKLRRELASFTASSLRSTGVSAGMVRRKCCLPLLLRKNKFLQITAPAGIFSVSDSSIE